MSEEKEIIRRVVEHFATTGEATDAHVTVTRLPDGKTSYVEPTADGGRGITLDEYRLGGHVVWAAYSARTRSVYLSQARQV